MYVTEISEAGVPILEYNALVDFYNSLNGDNWTNNTNWLDTINHSVSDWAGIQVVDSHVRMLSLDSNNVAGILPNTLADLKYLELLSLFQNNITGNLPDNIGELYSLRSFSLGKNNLSGEIPASITQMESLYYLGLSKNNMDGIIPTKIGDNANLEAIFLDNNNFRGTIPESIGNLSKLRHLRVNNNELSGTIPASIGNLYELRTLSLNNNQLIGPLPVELENLTKVYRLNIDNNLIGNIDFSEKSATLKSSTVENNRQIPDELDGLISMDTFRLGNNNLQFNDIEAIFSWDNFSDFKDFIYYPQGLIGVSKTILVQTNQEVLLFIDNYYHGNSDDYQWYKNGVLIPDANKSNLKIFSVQTSDAGEYHCKVTNPIATELTLTSKLISLEVIETIAGAGVPISEYNALVDFYNNLNGNNWTRNDNWLDTINHTVNDWFGITVEGGHVTQIYFDAYYNYNLDGSLPSSIRDLKELKKLAIITDNISGELPSGLFELTKLEELYIAECDISGNIPMEIGNLTKLKTLGLEANKIEGTIPSEIGNLTNLEFLSLYENRLSGKIPNSISQLVNLYYLGLAYNNLSGTIPSSFGNLIELEYLLLNNNQIVGPLPVELSNLTKINKFTINNNLIGTIENSNKSANLKSSETANNRQVPDELANLIQMDTLYLGNNNLQFNDIEAIFSWDNFNDFKDFIYYPQGLIGVAKTVSAQTNQEVLLFIDNYYNGNSDDYQWYKNGVLIPGANKSNLKVFSAQTSDAGEYHCKVTNPVATELTLTSKLISLEVTETIAGAGVPISEYLALVEIYDSTNGNAWTNNLNWLDTITVTVNDWFGVTVENGHVTKFEMPNNNLSRIPIALNDLPELKKADFSLGNFSGEIPNLENLASLDEFSLANNNFIFNDLIPITDWINYNNFKNSFNYSPQTGVGETESLTFYLGDTFNLEVKNYDSDNSDNFEWFRNGISIQNGEKYNLEKEAWFDDNNGVFHCGITNSLLPDLTLISEDINVTVNYSSNDSLALINLRNEYEILQEIWTNDSIFTWSNITFENGFVTAIDFSGLNMEGVISPIFTQFDSLVWLNLSNNNLSGEVPPFSNTKNGNIKSISSSKILTYLNIANNNFRFIDLETNASDFFNIDVFIYAPQQSIGQPLDTSIYKYEGITFEIGNYISGNSDVYAWFKDGQEVTGKNDLTFTIENAALQDSGYYTCSITNTLFADLTLHSDTSWLKVMVPVGIDNQKLSEFNIYPNPAQTRVYIDTKNETIDLKVFNLTGNLVLEKNNTQSGWIDIKQFTRGVYVFRAIWKNSETVNTKVIFK